jgi:hypothetical protein
MFLQVLKSVINLVLFNHRREKVKVMQSVYRPWQALRVPEGWGSQISWQSAYKGGKIVNPMHRPPLPPRKYYCYSFLLEVESTHPKARVRPEGLCQRKIPTIPSRIEPAIFRLVAQCLNETVVVTSCNLLTSDIKHATNYGSDNPGYKFRQGQEIDLSLKASTPALEPTQPPIQWVPGLRPGGQSSRD